MKEQEPSYKKVNYLLRLKKQIERKIIIEVFQKLNRHPDIPINEYCYFGLGSVYFADFILIHKYLNIENMISIEINKEDKKRFLFNKPYKFIKFETMASTELLEKDKFDKLKWKWNNNLLIWLDYDTKLSVDSCGGIMIPDFTIIGKKAKNYDIFITTIECWEGAKETKDAIKHEQIKKYLLLPEDFVSNSDNLKSENSPRILNKFIRGCIREGFKNYKRHEIDFIQIFHFAYKDTALMYTFGCIFTPSNKVNEFKKFCRENKIEYYEENDEPEKIDCPIITPKEKYFIDSCVKINKNCITCDERAIQTGLKRKEIDKYINYYKHYPQFFEAIY
jgi:hypothetical protein